MALMSTRGDRGDNSEVDTGALADSGSDVMDHFNVSMRRLFHISPCDRDFGLIGGHNCNVEFCALEHDLICEIFQ